MFKIAPNFFWPSSDRFDMFWHSFDLQVQAKLEEAFEMASDRREAGPEILGGWGDRPIAIQWDVDGDLRQLFSSLYIRILCFFPFC